MKESNCWKITQRCVVIATSSEQWFSLQKLQVLHYRPLLGYKSHFVCTIHLWTLMTICNVTWSQFVNSWSTIISFKSFTTSLSERNLITTVIKSTSADFPHSSSHYHRSSTHYLHLINVSIESNKFKVIKPPKDDESLRNHKNKYFA